MCECRSPRRSSSRDQLGQRPGGGRLELAAALAQLGRDPGQAEPLVDAPPRSRSASSRPSRRRGSRTPRRAARACTADSRSATLWSLEPVKCCSTLPNWSGATTLRSTFRPAWSITRAPGVARGSGRTPRRVPGERGDHARPSVGGGDDVEVLDRVGAAPQRAGDLDAVGARRARAARRRSARRSAARARAGSAAPACRRSRPRAARAASPRPSGRSPRSPRSSWRSAAARSASSESMPELVVEPARALGPEARAGASSRSAPLGNCARSFCRLRRVARVDRASRASPRASCRCPAARSRGRRARAARRTRRPRARPWRRCGRRGRGTTPRRRARRGRRARRRRRRSGRCVTRSSLRGRSCRGPAWIVLPTYCEAENVERDGRRRCARRAPRRTRAS